jgi:hypothetical protein
METRYDAARQGTAAETTAKQWFLTPFLRIRHLFFAPRISGLAKLWAGTVEEKFMFVGKRIATAL